MSLPSGTPPIVTTKVITADDYNRTAWLVNKVWADITDIPDYNTSIVPPNPIEYFVYELPNGNVVNREHANTIAFFKNISPVQRDFPLDIVPNDHDMVVVYLGDSVEEALTIPPNTGIWEIRPDGRIYLLGNGYSTPNSQFSSYTGKTLIVYNRESHTFGWGQGRFTSAVSTGAVAYVRDEELITAVHMNALIDRVNIMLRHVGAGVQIEPRMTAGEVILAEHANEIRDMVLYNVINEPNNTHMTMDVANIGEQAEWVSFTRLVDWGYVVTSFVPVADQSLPTDLILAATRYKFRDYNEARYFFNAGSDIRFHVDIDPSGIENDPATEYWIELVESLGTVRMKWDTVLSTNNYVHGESRDIGFYELSRNFQLVYTAYGHGTGGTYGGYGGYGGYFDPNKERIEVQARLIDKNSDFYVADPNNECAVYLDLQVAMISQSNNDFLGQFAVLGQTRVHMYFVSAANYTNRVSYSTHKPYDMEILENTNEAPQVDFDIKSDNYNG